MYYGLDAIINGMVLLFIVMMLVLLVALVGYILKGIGLYTLGKRRGMENAWMAFIPYARLYFQGELCGRVQLGKRQIDNPGLWIILISVGGGILESFVIFIFYGLGTLFFMGGREYYFTEYGAYRGLGVIFVGYAIVILFGLLLRGLVGGLMGLMDVRIYERQTTKELAIFHAVAGLFIPLYESIYLFVIRNREEKMGGGYYDRPGMGCPSGHPHGGNPAMGQPMGGRPEMGRPSGHPHGGNPGMGQPMGGRPEMGHSSGHPHGGNPGMGQPMGDRPEMGRPSGHPHGGNPAMGQPMGGRPEMTSPTGNPEGGEHPAPEKSVENAPEAPSQVPGAEKSEAACEAQKEQPET